MLSDSTSSDTPPISLLRDSHVLTIPRIAEVASSAAHTIVEGKAQHAVNEVGNLYTASSSASAIPASFSFFIYLSCGENTTLTPLLPCRRPPSGTLDPFAHVRNTFGSWQHRGLPCPFPPPRPAPPRPPRFKRRPSPLRPLPPTPKSLRQRRAEAAGGGGRMGGSMEAVDDVDQSVSSTRDDYV